MPNLVEMGAVLLACKTMVVHFELDALLKAYISQISPSCVVHCTCGVCVHLFKVEA